MTRTILAGATLSALLALSACSSDDDDTASADVQSEGEVTLPGDVTDPGDSTFNPDLPADPPSEEASGNDTTAIAGLWDATSGPEGSRDEKYVLISDDGLHTTYDYQQDDLTAGDNCYTVEPRRLDLELGEAESGTYSVSGQSGFRLTATDDPDSLTVTFVDESGADVNGGTPEVWPRVVGDTVENLTVCDAG